MITYFKDKDGVDLGDKLVPKEYLIERHPELADTFRFAGLWTWGYNSYGQLGTNDTISRSSPVQTIAGGTNWKYFSFSKDAFDISSCAIKTDGTLWTWGYNGNGMLGTNDTIHKSSPVQVGTNTNWKVVNMGVEFSAAIKTDGTLWTWGANWNGQLGTNDKIKRSSPVQTIAGGTNWKLVQCCDSHMTAIKTDGTLWSWGGNSNGQLGTNDTIDRSSPVQTIAGGTNWKSVSGGGFHIAAIKTDGTLWSWGYNGEGQLGTNDSISRSSPVQTIAGGTNWKLVSGGYYYTAAIKTDGTLWSWGYDLGRSGTSSERIIARSSPIQTIAGGTNWKLVGCGGYTTAAIKTDGTLWAWGHNWSGEIGTNDTIYRSSPVQVGTNKNWMFVANGGYSCNAAITDEYDDLI